MMKNILYLILMISILTNFSSCSDWLDVQPKTQLKNDKMFECERGFKDALTGAYISLKDADLYGKNLTLTTLEYLVQHWDAQPATGEDALKKYEYNNTFIESKIATIYGKLYSTIANLNNLLAQIDEKKDLFSEGMYELIKGEALTMRAYCHFDILRLFGPMPTNIDESIRLPYVTKLDKFPHTRSSFHEFIGLLIKDLNDAEALFTTKKSNGKCIDPIIEYSLLDVYHMYSYDFKPEDNYWMYRQNRMNYYTALALKARIFLWKNDKENALKYAKLVIDAKDPDGKNKFKITTANYMSLGDKTCQDEQISSVYIYDFKYTVRDLFETENCLKKSQEEVTTDLFNNEVVDSRYANLWTNLQFPKGIRHTLRKYSTENLSYNTRGIRVIPLIRLYEMYLIAVECSSLSEASVFFKEATSKRNLVRSDLNNEAQRGAQLLSEYQREFYAEGQLFYTYKRIGVENIMWTDIQGSEDVYVIPLPKKEIITK